MEGRVLCRQFMAAVEKQQYEDTDQINNDIIIKFFLFCRVRRDDALGFSFLRPFTSVLSHFKAKDGISIHKESKTA